MRFWLVDEAKLEFPVECLWNCNLSSCYRYADLL